jgi:hypothetical protein
MKSSRRWRKAQLRRLLYATPPDSKLCVYGVGWVYRRSHIERQIWRLKKNGRKRGVEPQLAIVPDEVLTEEAMRMQAKNNAEWEAEKAAGRPYLGMNEGRR